MKSKKQKFFIWGLVITMIAMYGFFPVAPNAKAVGSIYNASDTLSDSDVNQLADHTVVFQTATATPANGFLEVTLTADFGVIGAAGDISCPNGGTASVQDAGLTARCTYGTLLATSSGPFSITIADVQNPSSEGSQDVMIYNRNSSDTILDKVKVMVAIIEDVLVTATVDSSLTFTVTGTTTPLLGAYDCADTNSQTPTATSVPFGTLPTNGTAVNLCQQLNVTTNAQDGFVVTVEQDHELLSDSGANINSFNNAADNTGTVAPEAWTGPTNTLDQYNTYGHMGISSNDDALISGSGLSDFNTGSQLFAGLNSTDLMTVMDHDGPTDGSTQNVGMATVMYRAQIGTLQEAGDYQSTLTYICTPTF